jgi:hypothetical protein
MSVFCPLQVPPHSVPSLEQPGRAPWGAPVTGLQVPRWPGTSQAWHWPPHALLQHTPSTHSPDAHMSAAPQCSPSPRRDLQTPPEQKSPALQSASLLQPPWQLALPQVYSPQLWV